MIVTDRVDAADRDIADVNVGTDGGNTWTRPDAVPERSATVLVTSYTYNAAGWMSTVTDPLGIESETLYDALGETLFTIAAWDGVYDPTGDALPSSTDDDQTTGYTYDGDGHILTQTALEPSGTPSQTTQYVYGVSNATDSQITSNDLLRLVAYPDPSTGAASDSAAGCESYTYNAAGDVLTYTDRNGTTHSYSYDALGRQTLDAVTTLGDGVDGSVLAIGTTYNKQGLVNKVTSYSTAGVDAEAIVNQIQYLYNGLGQETAEYQSHDGAVDTDTTPVTQYAYSDPSTGSRLASMTYPNGTTLDYSYGASGSLNDAIGRLAALTQDGTALESYQYLGLSTVVSEADADGIILTDLQQPTDVYANTDGGDQYTGLDRFGRTIDQNYVTIATGATVERYQYTYDADGNVTSKGNLLDSSLNETYTYDQLNRLTSDTRGGTAYQSWDLDSLGNPNTITTAGTTQDNTTNSQNELTQAGDATLTFDNDGNTTSDDHGDTLIYDAWNRLVKVEDNTGATITTYSYDGAGRRITEAPTSGTTSDLYYSANWQVIEERQGGTAASNVAYTYVWSATYIDALLSRTSYTSGTPTQTLYAAHDANYNVTALVGYDSGSDTWQVQERYVYDAYGSVTILNPDFTVKSTQSTLDNWNYLFQGKRRDFADGLDDSRFRVYSPTLQRWLQQDPLGYVNGSDRFVFVISNPVHLSDPTGGSWWNVAEGIGWMGVGALFTAGSVLGGVAAFETGPVAALGIAVGVNLGAGMFAAGLAEALGGPNQPEIPKSPGDLIATAITAASPSSAPLAKVIGATVDLLTPGEELSGICKLADDIDKLNTIKNLLDEAAKLLKDKGYLGSPPESPMSPSVPAPPAPQAPPPPLPPPATPTPPAATEPDDHGGLTPEQWKSSDARFYK